MPVGQSYGDYLVKYLPSQSLPPLHLSILQACEKSTITCEKSRIGRERGEKEIEATRKEIEAAEKSRPVFEECLRIIEENNRKFRKFQEEWCKKQARIMEESRRLDEGRLKRDTEQFKPCNVEGLRLGSCKEKPTVKVAPKKTCLENTPTFTQGKTIIESSSPPFEPTSSLSVSRSQPVFVEAREETSAPVQKRVSFVATVINAFKQEITSLLKRMVDCFKFLFKKIRLS